MNISISVAFDDAIGFKQNEPTNNNSHKQNNKKKVVSIFADII